VKHKKKSLPACTKSTGSHAAAGVMLKPGVGHPCPWVVVHRNKVNCQILSLEIDFSSQDNSDDVIPENKVLFSNMSIVSNIHYH
jgi:hypothetical protein